MCQLLRLFDASLVPDASLESLAAITVPVSMSISLNLSRILYCQWIYGGEAARA